MDVIELENLGIAVCHSLLNQDYANIAQRYGYAIAFEKAPATAIKEDFEHSITKSGGALEYSNLNVTVKTFPSGTPGFINLIECRFIFANSEKEVLVEIIENEAGFYLEQISCTA